MGWFLLAHIGLPLLFGTAFFVFSAAVSPSIIGWDVLVETAQDLAILSLGATGAIFDNSRVEQAFGSNSALMAIGLVGVELVLLGYHSVCQSQDDDGRQAFLSRVV